MTSNTTPSGEASAGNSIAGSYDPWKAFDNVWSNNNDRWVTNPNVYGSYLQYEFDEAKEIGKMEIQFGDMVSSFHDCGVIIQGSNDGTTFTDLLEFTLLASENREIKKYTIPTTDFYTHYRIQFDTYNIIASGNYYNGIMGVQMYEKYLA